MFDVITEVGKWIAAPHEWRNLDWHDVKTIIPAVVAGLSGVIFTSKVWSTLQTFRLRYDLYDAAVDKYIKLGPESASVDLEALDAQTIDPRSAKQLKRELLEMKRMLTDLQLVMRSPAENAYMRNIENDPERLREFAQTIFSLEKAVDSAQVTPLGELDFGAHTRALKKYWRLTKSPYDQAIETLAEKTVSSGNPELTGQKYAEE